MEFDAKGFLMRAAESAKIVGSKAARIENNEYSPDAEEDSSVNDAIEAMETASLMDKETETMDVAFVVKKLLDDVVETSRHGIHDCSVRISKRAFARSLHAVYSQSGRNRIDSDSDSEADLDVGVDSSEGDATERKNPRMKIGSKNGAKKSAEKNAVKLAEKTRSKKRKRYSSGRSGPSREPISTDQKLITDFFKKRSVDAEMIQID